MEKLTSKDVDWELGKGIAVVWAFSRDTHEIKRQYNTVPTDEGDCFSFGGGYDRDVYCKSMFYIVERGSKGGRAPCRSADPIDLMMSSFEVEKEPSNSGWAIKSMAVLFVFAAGVFFGYSSCFYGW